MSAANFEIFGPSHIWALVITALAGVAMIRYALNQDDERLRKGLSIFIIFLIIGGLALMMVYKAIMGTFSIHNDLPMQLCDWAGLLIVATLIFRGRLTFELAYFWVLSGSTQALLTPDIAADFPSVEFTYFFMVHSGEIIGIFFLIFAFRMSPGRRSVIRAFMYTNGYVAFTFFINWLTKSNYGYLLEKPPGGSIMDFLGPWPWYIVSLEFVALVSYAICYMPYYIKRLRERTS